jgi:hypothetical protein
MACGTGFSAILQALIDSIAGSNIRWKESIVLVLIPEKY